MALSKILNRRVKALPDDEEVGEEQFSELSGSDDDNASGSGSGSGDTDAEDDEVSDEDSEGEGSDEADSDAGNDDIKSSINDISFGALAKAQESLGDRNRNRKRKRSDSTTHRSSNNNNNNDDDDKTDTTSSIEAIRAKIHEAREAKREKEGKNKNDNDDDGDGDRPRPFKKRPPTRTSKHAPTIQSSKYAVTRRRTVIEPLNTTKARDPRFDNLVLNHGNGKDHNSIVASASAAANKNYAFLNDYRASELAGLREELKKMSSSSGKKNSKATSPEEKEELKRKIRSMVDRQRAFEGKQREKEVRAEHRKKERELMREGKKSQPWFLKDKDVKREVLVKKFEGMGGKEKKKAIERRRKKVAGKEKKEMPWGRREGGLPSV